MIALFKLLAKDDQDSVRLQTIGACVEIAKQLERDDIDTEVRLKKMDIIFLIKFNFFS
jgi:hypothetical protein